MKRRTELTEEFSELLYGPGTVAERLVWEAPRTWRRDRPRVWRAWAALPADERPHAPWAAVHADWGGHDHPHDAVAYRDLVGDGFAAWVAPR